MTAISNDEEFLQEAYRLILGRTSDGPGLVNWLELLHLGVSRRTVLRRLINSEEGRKRTVEVTGLWLGALAVPVDWLGIRLRNAMGALGLARHRSVDFRLDLLRRDLAVKTETLTATSNNALVTLSTKLDVYAAKLVKDNRRQQEQLVEQSRRIGELERAVNRLQTVFPLPGDGGRGAEAFIESAEETGQGVLSNQRGLVTPGSPVFSAGPGVIVTEVDGLIVGVPGSEWRIAAYHAFRGVMEPGPLRYFSSVVTPGAVVVDVGANIGIYTLHAARLMQGRGKIYSFEPTPSTYEILQQNVQVNGFKELGIVRLHRLAVGDRQGIARFSIFKQNCGHNTLFKREDADDEIEVSVASLDEILSTEERVDIVKIDAEGAEPLIFRGMRHIIARSPAIRIILEFAPEHLKRAGSDPWQFLDDIYLAGFVIRRIDSVTGELMGVSRKDLEALTSTNLQLEMRERPVLPR